MLPGHPGAANRAVRAGRKVGVALPDTQPCAWREHERARSGPSNCTVLPIFAHNSLPNPSPATIQASARRGHRPDPAVSVKDGFHRRSCAIAFCPLPEHGRKLSEPMIFAQLPPLPQAHAPSLSTPDASCSDGLMTACRSVLPLPQLRHPHLGRLGQAAFAGFHSARVRMVPFSLQHAWAVRSVPAHGH